jgi:hypothetical protein
MLNIKSVCIYLSASLWISTCKSLIAWILIVLFVFPPSLALAAKNDDPHYSDYHICENPCLPKYGNSKFLDHQYTIEHCLAKATLTGESNSACAINYDLPLSKTLRNESQIPSSNKPTLEELETHGFPLSPEFSKFESVSTDDMVDPLSGDLTYNLPVMEIPGAHNGGYAVGLAYHSGSGPNDDASWVGHGWTLNPGAINRIKKGLPDDVKNGDIEQIHDVADDWTVEGSGSIRGEIYSIPGSLTAKLRYNNNKGFSTSGSASLGSSLGSLTYSYENGTGSFSPNISLSTYVQKQRQKLFQEGRAISQINSDLLQIAEFAGYQASRVGNGYLAQFSTFERPALAVPYKGTTYRFGFGLEGDPALVIIGGGAQFDCSVNFTKFTPTIHRKALGYLHSSDCEQNQQEHNAFFDHSEESNTVMDYAVDGQGPINSRDEVLSIPYANADVFQVASEGLAGTFRAFHNKTGTFMPVSSTSTQSDLGIAFQFHAGTDIGLGIGVNVSKEISFPIAFPSFVESFLQDNLNVSANIPDVLRVGGQRAWSSGVWDESLLSVPTPLDNKFLTIPNLDENGNSSTQKFNIEKVDANITKTATIDEDEPFIWRFNGDLGGKVAYRTDFNSIPHAKLNNLITAKILGKDIVLSTALKIPSDFPRRLITTLQDNDRVGRSNFIQVHKFKQMAADPDLYRYEKQPYLANLFDVNELSISEHIGEVVINTTAGTEYVYGLPVYVGNERNLQFACPDGKMYQHITDGGILGRPIAHIDLPESKNTIGELHNYTYPSSWLLTSIRSLDYKDLGIPGMSDDDLGGYTSFKYQLLYGSKLKGGSTSNWLNYRSPHSGFNIDQNNLWDPKDDMAAYSSGDKEQYLLDAIETRTHIAIFVTNKSSGYLLPNGTILTGTSDLSGPDRLDARSPLADDLDAGKTSNATNHSATQKMLRRIMLFAKPQKVGGAYKLIKTIKFQYDYSIWPNSIGSASINGSASTHGKLTLKKIWIEYANVKNVKVAPYQFEYIYPSANFQYPSQYTNLASHYQFTVGANGNPQTPLLTNEVIGGLTTDRWGNYDYKAFQNRLVLNPSTTQVYNKLDFDPAAYQLKQIILPTKAELHVQYEQDDYQFVQDERANIMVPLKANSDDDDNKYVIKKEVLGNIDPYQYASYLTNYFQNVHGPYVYFRFLYNLTASGTAQLPLPTVSCKSEYIDGHVTFINAVVQGGDVVLKLGDYGSPNGWTLGMPLTGTGQYVYPRSVCFDFIKRETGWQAGACDLNKHIPSSAYNNLVGMANTILTMGANIFAQLVGVTACASINPELSYLRLPIMPNSVLPGKKGGGLRVKRILSSDKGLEINSSDQTLVGTEYVYQAEDGYSSGVATNEPAELFAENAQVYFLNKRTPQSALNKVISGIDKQQFVVPYYRSMMPAPAVAYSRVISKSIAKGEAASGYTILEYHTKKDYPDWKGFSYTSLQDPDNKKHLPAFPISVLVIDLNISKMWATQGFQMLRNQMHGKLKRISRYPGEYDFKTFLVNSSGNTTNRPAAVYSKNVEYFPPGEQVVIYDGNVLSETYRKKDLIGVQEEIVSEKSCFRERRLGIALDLDAALGVPITIPSFGAFPQMSYFSSKVATFTTSAIVDFPTIVKSITEVKDKIVNHTENIAFSALTGEPVIMKVNDEYYNLGNNQQSSVDNWIYTYNQPASLTYQQMRDKSRYEGKHYPATGKIIGTNSLDWKVEFTDCGSIKDHDLMDGDQLEFLKYNGTSSTPSIVGRFIFDGRASSMCNPLHVYYPIDVFPLSASQPLGITYFDAISVLKSGRKNQLSQNCGTITTLGEVKYKTSLYNWGSTARLQYWLDALRGLKDGDRLPITQYEYDYLHIQPNTSSRINVGSACYNAKAFLQCWHVNGIKYLGVVDYDRVFSYAFAPPSALPIGFYDPKVDVLSNLVPSGGYGQGYQNGKGALLCLTQLGPIGGEFHWGPGQPPGIQYYAPNSPNPAVGQHLAIHWLETQRNKTSDTNVITNTLANKHINFSCSWWYKHLPAYSQSAYGPLPNYSAIMHPYLSNDRGCWRPRSTYAYKAPRVEGNSDAKRGALGVNNRNYNSGTYELYFENWDIPCGNENWFEVSRNTVYSPHGEVLEEYNAAAVPTCKKFARNNVDLVAVAANANYGSINFEHFEDCPTSAQTTNATAHTGVVSYNLPKQTTAGAALSQYEVDGFQLMPGHVANGIVLRFWSAHHFNGYIGSNPKAIQINDINVDLDFPAIGPYNAIIKSFKATRIASSGEWSLYELVILPTMMYDLNFEARALHYSTNVKLRITNKVSGLNNTTLAGFSDAKGYDLFIDDVRVQPYGSEMKAYVWDDVTRKPLAEFDDRHFAVIYQYNAEGKLMRVLRETERGIRAIEEQHQNVPNLINRPTN